jgi:CRP-like cAMP-binding protein
MADDKIYLPLLDIEEVLPVLDKMSILAGFSDKQLYSLFRLFERVSYKAGEIIFEQGQEPSHIYIIQTGKIKLFVSKDGTPFELIEFGQGHCFGEASVIGIQPHAATAVAVEDTELIVLSRTTLLSIYKTDLEIFSILILNIAREVCRRLHASSETLLHYKLLK